MTKDGSHGGSPVVLVTGASRGIGRATAERLAVRGWRVFAASRGPGDEPNDPDNPVPARQTFLRVDVRDPESLSAAVTDILARTGGRLDAVVANAGIAAVGMFEDTPAEVMASLLETNYYGALNTVRATLPALRANRGRIVVVSSDAALYGSPGLSGYSASKAALEAWAESISYELQPAGVCLSILQPGAFRTDIWRAPIHLPEDAGHRALAERVAVNWASAARGAGDPQRVAATIERALRARRPRLRYRVGNDARRAAVLRRVLPERAFRRWVEHLNGLAPSPRTGDE